VAMLNDILQFAAQTLVDNGRLSFWMPTANDENQEIPVPTHPYLEVSSVCQQVFNKCMFAPKFAIGDLNIDLTDQGPDDSSPTAAYPATK